MVDKYTLMDPRDPFLLKYHIWMTNRKRCLNESERHFHLDRQIVLMEPFLLLEKCVVYAYKSPSQNKGVTYSVSRL